MDHEYWCDLLYTIEVKDNKKMEATQIKRLAASKATYHYNRNESIRVPCKKRLSTGVIPNCKKQEENTPKYHRIQRYCVLFNQAGMPERKYISNSSEKKIGNRYSQHLSKDRLGGSLGNRYDSIKKYKNYKHKCIK